MLKVSLLSTFSKKDLTRLTQAKELSEKRDRLWEQGKKLRAELGANQTAIRKLGTKIRSLLKGPKRRKGKKAAAKKNTRKRRIAKNGKPLRSVLAETLRKQGEPLRAAELAKLVLARGFKTASKPATFSNHVANTLRTGKEFTRNKEGKYVLSP